VDRRARPRVAIVQDALPFVGGAERVLERVLELFPEAPVFTLVYRPEPFNGTVIASHTVYTSFINRLPGAHRHHRWYLPLYPLAIEQLDLRPFDLVLSFSYAAAHGVMTRPNQLHISYTYTPMRQAWHHNQDYLHAAGVSRQIIRLGAPLVLHYFRLWDQSAVKRVDQLIACSRWVAGNIWRAYRRPAQVIYPPVEVERYQFELPREGYYLAVSRLEPHKRLDLIVEAFARSGLPLIIIGDGQERDRLSKLATANIQFLGRQPDPIVADRLGRARGFVMAAEEDFGIAAVEAQAAGCPVIAYASGGALETVVDGKTGLLFREQSAACLVQAVQEFERISARFDVKILRRHAEQFNPQRFQDAFHSSVMGAWERFMSGGDEIRVTPGY
jgi:glycosyltransferase involved in cell wall biosynthesis